MTAHSPRSDRQEVARSATSRHQALALTAMTLLMTAGFLAWLLTVGVPVATIVLISELTLVATAFVIEHLLG